MTIIVNCTCQKDQKYATYGRDADGKPVEVGHVIIKGASSLLELPYGTRPLAAQTPIDDKQLEMLMANPVFKAHRDNGFIDITDKKLKADELAEGLELKDKAAPLTEEDIKEVEKENQKKQRVKKG